MRSGWSTISARASSCAPCATSPRSPPAPRRRSSISPVMGSRSTDATTSFRPMQRSPRRPTSTSKPFRSMPCARRSPGPRNCASSFSTPAATIPFKLASGDGKRSIGRGLARIEPGANELIAYAAREGTVASDGGGGANSPYATALAKYLDEPGLDVRLLFGRVRDDVKAATGDTQEPFIYGTLGGEALFLNAPAVAKAVPAAPAKTRGADAGAGGVVERGRPAVADGREDDELRCPAELHRSHFQGGQCLHRLRAGAQEGAQLRFRADRQAPGRAGREASRRAAGRQSADRASGGGEAAGRRQGRRADGDSEDDHPVDRGRRKMGRGRRLRRQLALGCRERPAQHCRDRQGRHHRPARHRRPSAGRHGRAAGRPRLCARPDRPDRLAADARATPRAGVSPRSRSVPTLWRRAPGPCGS